MNDAYLKVIGAKNDERRAIFLETAGRLGTAVQNVEKDFWVCWTLDALFNGLPSGGPRLLFKGGTSLSKAYDLIERFSEDIDITVFRDDLGEGISVEELEALSGRKRRARLDAIKASCRAYITGPLLSDFANLTERTMHAGRGRLEVDQTDPDGQTLLFRYPSVTAAAGEYVRSVVKIEAGAKSALDPHRSATVTPYVALEVPRLDLRIDNITTVDPERTFWDKLVILHGLRRWFERRGMLRHAGQRVTRHYYDVSRLTESDVGRRALDDRALAIDCARHARLFFNSADLDLDHAVPGTFALVPTHAMLEALRRDYAAMSGMIFGSVPAFDEVMGAIAQLEDRVNA